MNFNSSVSIFEDQTQSRSLVTGHRSADARHFHTRHNSKCKCSHASATSLSQLFQAEPSNNVEDEVKVQKRNIKEMGTCAVVLISKEEEEESK